MKCLSPISLRRSEGNSSADRICVPCGRCAACLSRKRSEWSFRVAQELKSASSAFFCTLTYADDFCDGNVHKKHIQDFLKRLRKSVYPNQIRYYCVSEYGSKTLRPHYHIILFNLPGTKEDNELRLLKTWQHGLVHVGTVTDASINYVTKYLIGKDRYPKGMAKPFSLMSKNPGIGYNYLDSHREYHEGKDRFYVTLPGGVKSSLPRYYKDKLYTEFEKEQYAVDCASTASAKPYIPANEEVYSAIDYQRRIFDKLDRSIF